MNSSPNLNRWAVTEKALKEGAPTIKGKPIGSGTEYRIDKHYPDDETIDVGTFSMSSVQDGYMTATAKITDNKAWDLLKANEWGPISVVILSYKSSCSECGADVNDEGYDHEHIKAGAHINVESFKFHRVDFVDDPAYPQAGMIDLSAQVEDKSQILTLAASYYAASHSNGAGPSSGGHHSHTVPKTDDKRKKKSMTEPTVKELQAELESLSTERDDLTAKVDNLETEIETLKAARDSGDDSVELKELRDEIDAMKASTHSDLVEATARSRFDAELVKDLKVEIERLGDFSAAHLEDLMADAKLVKARDSKVKREPRADFGDTTEDLDEFEAARKIVALRTIGHYRDANTLKIGET